MNKVNRLFIALITGLLITALSGCNLPSRSKVAIIITAPETEQSVVMGEETRVVSIATSSRGIESVALYINGELLSTDTPR